MVGIMKTVSDYPISCDIKLGFAYDSQVGMVRLWLRQPSKDIVLWLKSTELSLLIEALSKPQAHITIPLKNCEKMEIILKEDGTLKISKQTNFALSEINLKQQDVPVFKAYLADMETFLEYTDLKLSENEFTAICNQVLAMCIQKVAYAQKMASTSDDGSFKVIVTRLLQKEFGELIKILRDLLLPENMNRAKFSVDRAVIQAITYTKTEILPLTVLLALVDFQFNH